MLAIAVLDVLAKLIYGLMTVASDAKTTERDLVETSKPASFRAAA